MASKAASNVKQSGIAENDTVVDFKPGEKWLAKWTKTGYRNRAEYLCSVIWTAPPPA